MPQSVCGTCKTSVVKFSEFSYSVEQQQLRFNKTKIKLEVQSDSEEPKTKRFKIEEEPKKPETYLLAKISEAPEKIKPTSSIRPISTSTLGQQRLKKKTSETLSSDNASSPDKSVSSKLTTIHHLENVKQIFAKQTAMDIKNYQKITIPAKQLMPDGEVPRSWLKGFKDFTTWQEMKFQCSIHCKLKFDSFYDVLQHNNEHFKKSDRKVSCFRCNHVSKGISYLSSFINHMSKHHYEYIKFCCVICSKVFVNMPQLVAHYCTEHADVKMRFFPCLDCGLYCQSIYHLKSHRTSHDE